MTERIHIVDLPEFDASQFLDSDEAVATYLNDILQASHLELTAAALVDIERARLRVEITRAIGPS